MSDIYWSPVEIDAYNAIVAAHNARMEQRFVYATPQPPQQRATN